jgi:hypothetical protein
MNTQRRSGLLAPHPDRSGSVLVEFAFIALAFYLLFAGTIELGRMISTAQAAQNAARVGARELALVALPPTMNFRQALQDPTVKSRVYDTDLLAVPLLSGGQIPDTSEWPVINRMLTPLMIVDTIGGIDFYHYPGAVVRTASGHYSVKIPVISSRAGDGAETVSFHDVIEEVVDHNGVGPFSLSASSGVYHERGLVALRVNCPFQAVTLAAYRVSTDHQPTPIIEAHDSGVQVTDASSGAPLDSGGTGLEFVGGDGDDGAYGGKYGLGNLHAMNAVVRPFRRLISSQSLFRREVYR